MNKNKYTQSYIWLILLMFQLTNCTAPEIQIPELISLDQNIVSPGSPVTIFGQYLDNTIYLTLGGEGGIIIEKPEISEDRILFQVPLDLPTGDYELFAESINGLSNGLPIQVISPLPFITSVSPTFGKVGAEIVLRGNNLGGNDVEVALGGTKTNSFIEQNETSITFLIPNDATVGEDSIYVIKGSFQSKKLDFMITEEKIPSIVRLDKTMASPGDTIKVIGDNLNGSEVKVIFFENKEGEISAQNDSCIWAIVPSDAETGDLIVNVDGSSSNSVFFTVMPPDLPTIAGVNPDPGIPGRDIFLIGDNLDGGSFSILFQQGATQIGGNVLSPGGPNEILTSLPTIFVPGVASVFVVIDGDTSNVFNFSVGSPAPILTSLNPNPAGGDTLMRIFGQNLKDTQNRPESLIFRQGSRTFFVNSTISNATELRGLVPKVFSNDSVFVTAEVNGLESNPLWFTFIPPPVISSVSANPISPGNLLEINGRYFEPNNPARIEIKFSDGLGGTITTLTNTVISNQKITVTVPNGAKSGALIVKTPYGVSDPFNIVVSEPSTITSIVPSSNGPNYPIFIYGDNLENVTSIEIAGQTYTSGFVYSASCDCIGGNIPNISPSTVNFKTKVNSTESNAFPYTINNSLGAINPPGPPIIFPLPPAGISLGSVANNWLIAENPDVLSGGLEPDRFNIGPGNLIGSGGGVDTIEIVDTNGGAVIGRYTNDGELFEITLDQIEYVGKQDSSYNAGVNASDYSSTLGYIPRIILTPKISGFQWEMIFPYALESASALLQGNEYSVNILGRYFSCNEFGNFIDVTYLIDDPNDSNPPFELDGDDSNTSRLDDGEIIITIDRNDFPTLVSGTTVLISLRDPLTFFRSNPVQLVLP